jgi:hypothetical protein
MPKRLCVLVVVLIAAASVSVSRASAQPIDFKADVQDSEICPGVDLCGGGVMHGFGKVTTSLSFATFERVFVLADGSTLRLALALTGSTGIRLDGTRTVVGSTGVFDGASGSGVVWATPRGLPITSDTAHYRGTIELD